MLLGVFLAEPIIIREYNIIYSIPDYMINHITDNTTDLNNFLNWLPCGSFNGL